MQKSSSSDQSPSFQDLLYAIVNRMLEPHGKSVTKPQHVNALAGPQYPFDISKPSQHDSKAEFQREYDAVTAGISNSEQLIEALFPHSDDEASVKIVERMRWVINSKAKSNAPYTDLHSSTTMIRKNIADVGAYGPTIMVLFDLKNCLLDRLQELENQKEQFWSLKHRAPDYFARALALRLAQVFARETGQRPTYGLSGETGEPSTGYSRALKEVFALFDITSQERGYAEWAVSHITEKDFEPKNGGLLGTILGTGDISSQPSITDPLTKNPLGKPPQK
jgi:hypothetical protein